MAGKVGRMVAALECLSVTTTIEKLRHASVRGTRTRAVLRVAECAINAASRRAATSASATVNDQGETKKSEENDKASGELGPEQH